MSIVLRSITLIVLSILTIGCCKPDRISGPVISREEVNKLVRTSHVSIAVYKACYGSDWRSIRNGSGTVIAYKNKYSYVLTAKHVVKGNEIGCNFKFEVIAFIENGFKSIRGEIYRTHKTDDLALIKLDGFLLTPTEIDFSVPTKGEDLIVIGSPEIETIIAMHRSVYEYSHYEIISRDKQLRLSKNTIPGFSGGGAYNPDSGKLRATCTHKDTFFPYRGICIPLNTQKEFLSGLVKIE